MSANSIAEKFEVIADAVYEQGQKSEYDKFWDDFQQNGTRTNYVSAFSAMWTSKTLKPKYPVRPIIAYFMFFNNWGQAIEILDFVEFCDNVAIEQGKSPEKNPDEFDKNGHYQLLDFSQCTNAQYGICCLKSQHFGVLDFRKCTNLTSLFYGHGTGQFSVRKIDEFISSETTTFDNNTFSDAMCLTDIKMSGVVAKNINFGACPLNKSSLESVVCVLSTTATGKTATFKKTAVNSAFGVNVDDVSTYTEEFNEWRNGRSNWTFSYV